MASITDIWRHPIKSHGHETLGSVIFEAGKTMPWDRTWAVAHEAAKADGSEWASCANFSRGAKAPGLMAITAVLNEAEERLTLSHPDLTDFSFRPEHDLDAFLAWVAPLMPQDRAASARFVRVPGRGMTDSDFPSVSILSRDTLDDLSAKMGQTIAARRFRGNLWLRGFAPWEEFDWIGKTLRIGAAEFEIRQRITRCKATTANPDTGLRDADTLAALQDNWSHQDLGVYGVVTKSGAVALGDAVEVL